MGRCLCEDTHSKAPALRLSYNLSLRAFWMVASIFSKLHRAGGWVRAWVWGGRRGGSVEGVVVRLSRLWSWWLSQHLSDVGGRLELRRLVLALLGAGSCAAG